MNNKTNESWDDVFIVTCQGFSASVWLASQLNSHVDIMCAHNVTPITDFILSKNFDKETHMEMSAMIQKHYRANTEFTVSHSFDLMKLMQPSKFYGNVHAYQLSNLRNAAIPENVPVLDLIRNPISTVNSYSSELAKPEDETQIPKYEQVYQEEIVIQFLELYQKEYDYLTLAKENNDDIDKYSNQEIYSFIRALSILEKIADDYQSFPLVNRVITIPMEKITVDKEYFREVFSILTREMIDLESDSFEQYLDRVITSEASNKHSSGKTTTPEEIFNGWQNWQKIAFSQALQNSELISIYKNVGYDLDFVK